MFWITVYKRKIINVEDLYYNLIYYDIFYCKDGCNHIGYKLDGLFNALFEILLS